MKYKIRYNIHYIKVLQYKLHDNILYNSAKIVQYVQIIASMKLYQSTTY